MQVHQLKRKTKNKKHVQVGRGGTRGKTSGRGTKGQNARSGRKKRPELRDIIKKLPKLRGRGKNSNVSIQTKPVTISLDRIAKTFKASEKINPSTIVAKGLAVIYKGRLPKIKILSDGEVESKLTFTDCMVSAGAKEKIEKAGGSVK